MYTITSRADHLLVELRAITCEAVAAATRELMARSDYPHRNDLWDFSGTPVLLSQEDLAPLISLVAACYPAEATRTRTALVVRGGFQTAVAEMWCAEARRLPCEVQAFTSRARAEAWLSAPCAERRWSADRGAWCPDGP